MAQIMSNGKYKSVEHRAVVNENRSRVAVAVGNGPGYDVIVKPVAHLVDNNPADETNYKPKLFKELRFRDYNLQQQSTSTKD